MFENAAFRSQLSQVFGQIFDQIFGQIFDQGFWPGFLGTENTVYSTTGAEKYSFTVLPGQKNTVLQYYRDGEKWGKRPCIKNPILLKIPY